MNKAEHMRCKECAAIIKAAAHPSRVFIIEELAKRDHCVCELTEMIGADISTVSRHLAILRSAGLVSSDKDGTRVVYRLKHPCAQDFAGLAAKILRTEIQDSSRILSAANPQ